MSSAGVEPPNAARATNPAEPAIESNGCSRKAEQSSPNAHVTTIDDATITKTTPDKLFDGLGDGLDAAAELASDPVAITSEQYISCDKELRAETNEGQVKVSTITIEKNQEREIDAKELVGDKQPDPTPLPKSILRNPPTAESTSEISNETLSEVKDQSYEDIMSSAYASLTPSQVPSGPPLHQNLDVPSTIHESEPPADNAEPLQDTFTAPSPSQDAPPTPPSAMPQPYEADVTPRDEPLGEQVQTRSEGHAVDVDPQPEVAAEPTLVASGNLNALSPVPAAEPSSSADSPSAGGDGNGPSRENGTIDGEMDAQVTNETSVALAKQAKQNGHAEGGDKSQLEATVAEPAEESPADTAPAPVLDETTVHAKQMNPTLLAPTERMRPNETGRTDTGKEAREHAPVAHGDVAVSEAVPAKGHDSARGDHGGDNPTDTEEPADVVPTPVPNETDSRSETDAQLPSQQEPAESLDETSMVDRAKEGSAEHPSQPTTGDQDPTALPLSAETTEVATSQSAELVIQAAEPLPSSDPAYATVDKGSELVTSPHGQTEVEEQPERNAIVTGESKEEAPPTAIDVENSISAPQCPESAVKETEQAASGQQEEGTTSATPVHETPTQAATDAQDPAPTEPGEDIPAQLVELASTAPDPQANTKDPVVPSLPLVDRPEAINDLAEDSTLAAQPEEPDVNVQAETEEHELEGIPKEGGDDLAQPVSNADPAQRELEQEEAVGSTEGASDSQPTNAVPVDEPSLPLPESERVDDSNPFTDPAPTAECEQPIPITDTVTEEPSTHMASQADTSAQPASVSGGYAPSRLEDKVDLPFVEAAQTSEDQQIGGPIPVEKAAKEAPPNANDQSDAHSPAPNAEESAQEPLIRLHQDQQPSENANEAVQPCDPASIVEVLNGSQIDASFKEPKTTSVLEDNKGEDDSLLGSSLVESSTAIVNDLGVKEHSGVPLVEEPQEQAYIEGAKGYDSTAIVNPPNIELRGAPVVESPPGAEGATQDEHDVAREIQLESLDAPSNGYTGAVEAPTEPPAAVPDDTTDALNLEGSTEIIEQLEMGDAVSGVPTVEGGEKSSVEPPKGVEAYDRDKDPEVASDDSEAAGEQQTEVAQESSTHGFEGVAPAQAEEQDTPTDSNHRDISPEEVIPTDRTTIPPAQDSVHVATVECPAEEPIQSIDQDGKTEGHPNPASKESVVEDAVDGGPETRETTVDPLSEVTPAEPDKIVIQSATPIESKDQQSVKPSKDESPAPHGGDPVAEPFEAEGLPNVNTTSTPVVDTVREVELDHGRFGLAEGITQEATILRDETLPEKDPNAEKASVDQPSKEWTTEPAPGETPPVDPVLASETYGESITEGEGVLDLANEGLQSMDVQPFQRPSDDSNNVEELEAVKLKGDSTGEPEAFSTMEPSEDTPPAPLTDEDVVAGTTVEDITAIENSIEPPVVATTGDINSGAGSHPEQALHGACHGQGPGDGQEDRTPVSESEVKHSVVPAEAVSTVKGPASSLKSETQVVPVVSTVDDMDEGSTINTKGRDEYNVEDPAPPTLAGIAGDNDPQESGRRTTPASDGLHIRSEQDRVALEAREHGEVGPKSPIAVTSGHNACIEETSSKGEPLQPVSPKPVVEEAPQNCGLDQQNEVIKHEEKAETPPFPTDKLDASCAPEESTSYLAQPPLDESKASAPTELVGNGHSGIYEPTSVIQSDDHRAQAPTTSRGSGSEEPALHHMDPPAGFTIEKGKNQPVLEEATQEGHSTTPDETLDMLGLHGSRPPLESSATTKHEDESQPAPGFVREPVVHDAAVLVLSNDHALLDHLFIVDTASPEQEVQDQHKQVTNGAPLTVDEISLEGLMHGAVKGPAQEGSSTIDSSGGELLARQINNSVCFAADKAQPQDDSGAVATEPEVVDENQAEVVASDNGFKHDPVHGDLVGQDHVETMQPNAINDQALLPSVESRVEQSRVPVPDITSTSCAPPTVITTMALTNMVHKGVFAESSNVADQGEDGNAPCARNTTPGGAVASESPCGESAEPSHEVEATTDSALNVKPTDELIPPGSELLSDINTDVVVTEDDVDHTWVADDSETATTVVLPDPPSIDPMLSISETTALAKLDTEPSHSEVTPETIYIALLSPQEAHEQQVSYLVGELPKVTVMVPPAGPQTINQEVEIQEKNEAEQAAEKIEAERNEMERSVTCSVEPDAVDEEKTAPVPCGDESTLPVESVAEGMGISHSTTILNEPPKLGDQEQDAGIEQLAEKAASEVSVDDTILDEPALTETSDGEPITISTDVGEFGDTQETLKSPASVHGETAPTLPVADVTLVADPTPPPAIENATCPPPAEAAATTNVSKDEEHEPSEQGPPDVDITPSADENKPPAAIAADLEPSPSAEPTIERVDVVENVAPSNDAAVERTTVEPVTSTVCEDGIAQAQLARDQTELSGSETGRLAKEKGVVEELAAKEEADRAAREAAEKARIEQVALETEEERQAELELEEEREAERVKPDEAERVDSGPSEPRRQTKLVENQRLMEEEAQKLRDTEIAKLEAEAACLEAEYKKREQDRLLAKEKEVEEASDCPVAPSTPRSELSSITSGFDSPSQISLASHMATAPDSPRIAPEDPTPFVELPESDLILQNRSPKSINSSIAGEPPETPLGSLPNNSLLASDVTPPARTFSQTAAFKLGSPLKLSTENVAGVAGNNSTENVDGSHPRYDPPPVLVPKLSVIPASTAKLHSNPKPVVDLPELRDMVFPSKGGVEDLPTVVEDEDADVLSLPAPRKRHLSTVSNFSISYKMPGGWTHSSTIAEGRPTLDVVEGEFSPVPRTPRPSAIDSESDGEKGSRCIIM